MSVAISDEGNSILKKFKRKLFGAPKDLNDPGIFHKIALIPFFAWIGLGADGLSSSAYGPEEAFRALGSHVYLSLFLALATALTVFVIAYAYSRIIEHFPHGGGGYIVATHMLGERAGVISGSALIVDYILTIAVSISSCTDAIFSYMPVEYQAYKLPSAAILIIFLIILNIRGAKESITVLAPIFVIFLLTHIFMLGYGIFSHAGSLGSVVVQSQGSLSMDTKMIGFAGILFIFVRAFSLGGGTYTGIEAVSNGLQIMREPRVKTGKKTMVYMATSLALAAGGLFLCYLLVGARITEGKTLNSVLADALFGGWKYGPALSYITIFSEGALLLVAAQTGFIDAPRVMANMAVDSWLPRRFAAFSERLTMRNGIILIGIAALFLLLYTRGSISALVVMYSINVFLTFSLSEFGMTRFYFKRRKTDKEWLKHISVHLIGLVVCMTILIVTVMEKFMDGGWMTLLITSSLIFVSYKIRAHYNKVQKDLSTLEENIEQYEYVEAGDSGKIDSKEMTAIQLVGGYSGFGIHSLFAIMKDFRGLYKNFVFVSVAVIDQGLFKGEGSLDDLKANVEKSLKKYVALARHFGYKAEYRLEYGTDVVETASKICLETAKEFPASTVFSGKLAFREEKFYHKVLHNDASYAIQRRLQWQGITNVILPIKVGLKDAI